MTSVQFAFRSIPQKKIIIIINLNTWHVTKKETKRLEEKRGGCTNDTMRIVSYQRLRVSSVLCNAGTEAKRRRDSATVHGIESSSTIYRFMHTIYGGARAGNVFRGRVTFIRDAFGTPAGPFILQKLLFVPLFAFFPRPELLSSRVSRVFFCLQRDMHPLIEVIPCLAIKFNGVCFRANLDRTDLSPAHLWRSRFIDYWIKIFLQAWAPLNQLLNNHLMTISLFLFLSIIYL